MLPPPVAETYQNWFTDGIHTSYQVPKEVGKVGTESPTFIQPIAQRKDGIQAMFAKQKTSKLASPATTPASSQSQSQSQPQPQPQLQSRSQPSTSLVKDKKRKRSMSPPKIYDKHETTTTTRKEKDGGAKKKKVEKAVISTWEDDSDIECIDPPTKNHLSSPVEKQVCATCGAQFLWFVHTDTHA